MYLIASSRHRRYNDAPMKTLLEGINEVLLLGPGPSSVPPAVYAALGRPTLGYMDAYFIRIMDEVKRLLQKVIRTGNELTLPLSGTGTAGMEACLANLIEPGDAVLILINGYFGGRMQEMATRLGAKVDTLEFEWGTPVAPEAVARKLKEKSYKLVAMVHAETSTGVANPAAEVGELLRGKETLYLLDTVTSLGGIPVEADGWGVDALYSGSQKCLSCPPGLAPVSFSPKAVEALKNRRSKVPNWYLDLSLLEKYWGGEKRVYHHTPPINMVYAFYQALLLMEEEGLERSWERHRKAHEALVSGLEGLGLRLLVAPAHRLPMLNAVSIPEGADDARTRARLRQEHKIEIGAGLGPLAGKVWRIGLMGYAAQAENAKRLVAALRQILKG
jgi:alanine-glyoxylate transaminase/serine-glyoxylate transaminase/serine-pyruvate transaminase